MGSEEKMVDPCGSTSLPFTTHHIANCNKSCVKCRGTGIAPCVINTARDQMDRNLMAI